jgi:tetratricopeptide (TPR) repeat protein
MPAKQKPRIDKHAHAKLIRSRLLAAVLSLGLTPPILLANTAAQDAPPQAQSDATLQRALAEALKAASSISDPTERASTYNSIAMREWQIGATKEAQRHFDLAHRISLQMSQDDLTCAIRQGMNEERASAGDLEGALRNLSNCGPHSPPSEEQDFIFSSMAQYELKSGNLSAALSHIQTITRPDLRDGALTQIAYSAARSGHFQESLNLADKITEMTGRVTALNGVALILFKQGQSEKASLALQFALLAANGIPKLKKPSSAEGDNAAAEPNPDLNAYSGIAGTFADTGDFQKAIAIVDQNLEGEVKDWAIMYIAVTAGHKGRPDVIRQLNPQAREPHFNAEVTSALAEALARFGDQKQAVHVAENGVDLTTQASAFVSLAEAAFHSGDHASGKEFSQRATILADAISDPRWRGGLFWQLARIQIKAGENADAIRSLSRVNPDDVGWRMMGELAKYHVRAGDIPGALEVANKVRMISRARILNDIASEQARLGDEIGALSWVEPLTSPDERSQALLGVALGILARTYPDPEDD